MNSWDSLSMNERADVMKLFIEKGIYNLDTIRGEYNRFAEGGGVHIKDSKKGTFTAAASKHNMGVQEFASKVLANKDDYSPAMVKKANFARNFGGKKKSYGGSLKAAVEGDADIYAHGGLMGNYYDGWGDFVNALRKAYHKVRGFVGTQSDNNNRQGTTQKETTLTYRNRPAETVSVKGESKLMPARQRPNSSKTKNYSESLEYWMRDHLVSDQESWPSNSNFDIPFIPEKAILLGGSTTSTNVLDSLAKYAGIHNRNPQLSEKPIMRRSKYASPRKVNLNEMLGLSYQETRNGAWPYFNTADMKKEKNYTERDLANSNYLTAYGYIPAENLVRDFHYNAAEVSRDTPPLLDAFRYFAQGDYNRNDPNHTRDVNLSVKEAWKNPNVRNWWEQSGKYWYNTGRGPKGQ